MDERRRICQMVWAEGKSMSLACRTVGVSRPTGRLWVGSAREEGLDGILRRQEANPSLPPGPLETIGTIPRAHPHP